MNKIKNKRGEMSFLTLSAIIIISGILMLSIFNYGSAFVDKTRERKAIEDVDKIISNFDISNFTGKGFGKDRIKYQIMLIRDNKSYIDIYYYREFFERDLVTGHMNPTPQYEFYGTRRYNLGEKIKLDFDETNINGNVIVKDLEEDNYILGIKRTLPKNNITIFNASSTSFKKLDDGDKIVGKEFSIFGEGLVTLYEGPLVAEKDFDILPGVLLGNYKKLNINVLYRNEKIGSIIMDSDLKKIYFTNKHIAKGN